MPETLSLIIAAALVNNVVFIQLLGISAIASFSQRLQPAIDMAIFSAVVLISSTSINLLLYWLVLQPLGLDALRLILFVVVCGTLSAVLALQIQNHLPLTNRQQSVDFFVVGGNSAFVGLALQNSSLPASLVNFASVVAVSVGAALGFALALIGVAAMRLRLETADTPGVFRDSPILLVSAGIAAMGFLGFSGLL